jgi:cytochrome c5
MGRMRRGLKIGLVGLGAAVGALAVALSAYAMVQSSAFDESMAKVYDVPVPKVTVSKDPAVLARGEHLAKAVAACASRDCHGTDLGGGKPIEMGPLGTFAGPNISASGLGAAYSDGELARLVQHGVKKDGRSVRFMPAQDFGWLPDDDVAALVSWMRAQPGVDRDSGGTVVKTLGKVLDRKEQVILDVARHIDHERRPAVPAPAATAEYGAYLAKLCTGCHGKHLSGGKIPGAPPSVPIPLNLTPHATGLAGWTYDDFDKLLTKGIRKNGQMLNPFMPIVAFGLMDDTEKRALFAYLMSLPPKELGNR